MAGMKTTRLPDAGSAEAALIPAEVLADLQDAAQKAATGDVFDCEERRKAREEMDRIREEIRAKHGIVDIGVPAIRELRDA